MCLLQMPELVMMMLVSFWQTTSTIDPGDKKKNDNDKIEQEEVRTFEQLAVEWRATNKKWSEEHSRRVLKIWRITSFQP